MTGNEQRHEPLQPHVADRLLDMLSRDDDFREFFQKNPAAALMQLEDRQLHQAPPTGPIAEGDMFYCMTAETLAPKEEIARAREELKAYLTKYTDHSVVHCFEAGKIASTLRLK